MLFRSKGVQKILREQGARYVMELGHGAITLLGDKRLRVRRAQAEVGEEGEGTGTSPAPLVPVAMPPASNVHPFLREREARPRLAPEVAARLGEILSELTELKTRLRVARGLRPNAKSAP